MCHHSSQELEYMVNVSIRVMMVTVLRIHIIAFVFQTNYAWNTISVGIRKRYITERWSMLMSVGMAYICKVKDRSVPKRLLGSNGRTVHNNANNLFVLLFKLKSYLRKFYGRHHDLFNRYGVSVSQMTTNMCNFS